MSHAGLAPLGLAEQTRLPQILAEKVSITTARIKPGAANPAPPGPQCVTQARCTIPTQGRGSPTPKSLKCPTPRCGTRSPSCVAPRPKISGLDPPCDYHYQEARPRSPVAQLGAYRWTGVGARRDDRWVPSLVGPTVVVRESFLAAMREFADEGRAGDNTMVGRDLREWGGRWETDEGFEAYVAAVVRDQE